MWLAKTLPLTSYRTEEATARYADVHCITVFAHLQWILPCTGLCTQESCTLAAYAALPFPVFTLCCHANKYCIC